MRRLAGEKVMRRAAGHGRIADRGQERTQHEGERRGESDGAGPTLSVKANSQRIDSGVVGQLAVEQSSGGADSRSP